MFTYFLHTLYSNQTFTKRRVNTNFCNSDSCISQVGGHKLIVINSNNNGFITRYCVRIPDAQHLINTVVVWIADHSFGFFQNKFGQCNALMNFSKEHFKCIENNHETYAAILKYYPTGKYQRVYGAAATRFFGLHDSIHSMYHCRPNTVVRNNSNSNDNNGVSVMDCATSNETTRYKKIFKKCLSINKTFHNVVNAVILQCTTILPNNTNNNDSNNSKMEIDDDVDSDEDNSDSDSAVLRAVMSNSPNSKDATPQTTIPPMSASGKPPIKIDINSLVTRDSTKDVEQLIDFKKWLLYPSVLIDYVKKHKIKKKTYFDTISFLKTRLSHCAMMVFNANIKYGLFGLKTFFESNFSRSNDIATKLCQVFRSIKVLKMCLIQKIESIDEKLFEEAIECHLKNKDWCKWTNRKTCMMTVSAGSRTFPQCNGSIDTSQSRRVCDKHCQQFKNDAKNMNAIRWLLSPSLNVLREHLEYLELFFDDMFVDFTIANVQEILNYVYKDWFEYITTTVYQKFASVDGFSDEFLEAYFYVMAIIDVDWMYFKIVERFKHFFDPPLIVFYIGDKKHGKEYAKLIAHKIGFEKLINDTATFLWFETATDLLDSLRNDGVYMFETHLGWIWPFLRKQIVLFANSEQYDSLEQFGQSSIEAGALRMWVAGMCSQIGETMRIETVNKIISKIHSQQCNFSQSMKVGLLSGINYHKCLTPSPLRYDINTIKGIPNKKYTHIPGNNESSVNAYRSQIDDLKYHQVRRQKAQARKDNSNNIQIWRNNDFCKNNNFSIDDKITTISTHNNEIKKNKLKAAAKERKKQIKAHRKSKNGNNNRTNDMPEISSTDPFMIGLMQSKRRNGNKSNKSKLPSNHKDDIDLNIRTDVVDHGGFHSDPDELNEFHSDNSAELNDSDIVNVLNVNDINLSAGIDVERKDEAIEQGNNKNNNECTNTTDSWDTDIEYLQELLARDTESIIEELMPKNMSENETDIENNRLNQQIAHGSDEYKKWKDYEKSFYVQYLFWMIKLAMDQEAIELNDKIKYFQHCMHKMYGIEKKAVTTDQIFNAVNKYYSKWDELNQNDKDLITAEYVKALESCDGTKKNIRNDKNAPNGDGSNDNVNNNVNQQHNDPYDCIKHKVVKTLEKFDLESFKEYLYNQNKITFNASTQRQLANGNKQRKRKTMEPDSVSSMADLLKQYGRDVGARELTVVQLKSELRKRGLKVSGVKATLIERLEEFFGDTDDKPPKKKPRVYKR